MASKKVRISDRDGAEWWAQAFPDTKEVDYHTFADALIAKFNNNMDQQLLVDMIHKVIGKFFSSCLPHIYQRLQSFFQRDLLDTNALIKILGLLHA